MEFSFKHTLVRRHVSDVLVVEPLDLEVQVHVLGALAHLVLLVLAQRVLDVLREQLPHHRRAHLAHVQLLWKSTRRAL